MWILVKYVTLYVLSPLLGFSENPTIWLTIGLPSYIWYLTDKIKNVWLP